MTVELYGLGNALVDHEFHTTDELLAELNIEKGLTTLIDPDRADVVLSTMTERQGPASKACGGSGANSVITACAMGSSSYYAAQLADDENGHFYVRDMRAAGVQTHAEEHMVPGMTGRCFVMVTPDAERTMNTSLGVTGDLSEASLHPEVIKSARAIYLEGYLITSDISRATAIAAKRIASEAGLKVIGTFSDPGLTQYFKPQLEELFAGGVDLLFCNEEELQIFTETDTVEAGIEAIRPWTKDLVVTLGSEGAIVVTDQGQTRVAGQPAHAVDTNGAGDAFAGAFVHGLLSGWSYEHCAAFGCTVAARVVETFGPRLPIAEYAQLRKIYAGQMTA